MNYPTVKVSKEQATKFLNKLTCEVSVTEHGNKENSVNAIVIRRYTGGPFSVLESVSVAWQ